jgi:hypothetical protein
MEMTSNEMQLNRKVEKWAASKNAMSSPRVNDEKNSAINQRSSAVPSLRELFCVVTYLRFRNWKSLAAQVKNAGII